MLNRELYSNKGFTFLETLIAIFVLMVGVLGALIVVESIAFSARFNASKLAATYLAQEGIELVRNKRDSNWLAGVPWDSELPVGTTTGLLGRFTRTITIESIIVPPPPPAGMRASVKVSWQERGRSFSVTAETKLWNWR